MTRFTQRVGLMLALVVLTGVWGCARKVEYTSEAAGKKIAALEKALAQANDAVKTLTAGRSQLLAERDGLRGERDTLTAGLRAESALLADERQIGAALAAKWEAEQAVAAGLRGERDALAARLADMTRRRDSLAGDLAARTAERDEARRQFDEFRQLLRANLDDAEQTLQASRRAAPSAVSGDLGAAVQ